MNHVVPFCHFPNFEVLMIETRDEKGCGTISLFSRFLSKNLESNLFVNHVVPFRYFPDSKV